MCAAKRPRLEPAAPFGRLRFDGPQGSGVLAQVGDGPLYALASCTRETRASRDGHRGSRGDAERQTVGPEKVARNMVGAQR